MKKRIISLFIAGTMLLSSSAVFAEEYLDITKRSIGEAANANGFSYEEYKKYMALNEDTPSWESEHAAEFGASAMNIVRLYGITVDEFKDEFGITIDITDDTTMCDVYDSIPLSQYFGEDFEYAKLVYSLTDDITPDTLYGKVRDVIEKVDMDSVERKVFSDVGYSHWAHYYITKMLDENIIDGYDAGTYLPEKIVTRAEFAKILAETAEFDLSEENIGYADVTSDKWYAKYVNAVGEYISADADFNPEAPATREVVATAIVKVLGVGENVSVDTLSERFTDIQTITTENALYIADAVDKGIIDGFDDNTIRGNESLTRAQAATMLYRAFNEYADISSAFNIVVMKSGDYEITLGDVLLCYPLDDSIDYSDKKELSKAIAESVDKTAELMSFEYVANESGIKYEDVIDVAVQARAKIASSYGYREFCNILNKQGTSIEFYDRYILMLSYEQILEQLPEYTSKINPEIEIFDTSWADVMIEDIAKG